MMMRAAAVARPATINGKAGLPVPAPPVGAVLVGGGVEIMVGLAVAPWND
jgi:hypothetical protein